MNSGGWPTELIVLSGRTPAELLAALQRINRDLPHTPLATIAWREADRLTADGLRLALVAGSAADLAERLQQAAECLSAPAPGPVRDPRGLYFSPRPLAREGRLAVLFPGDGSPYLNMLADLRETFAEVRDWFAIADACAVEAGRPALSTIVYPGELPGHRERRRAEHRLRRLENSGMAVLAGNQGLYTLLRRLKLAPDLLIGHSLGDWSALGAAGVSEIERFLHEFEENMLLPAHVTQASARMGLAVCSREVAEAAIARVGGEVYVAMHNGPRRVILAGAKRAVRAVMDELGRQGVQTYRLPFVRAAHTPLAAAICEPLRQALRSWGTRLPQLETWSCCAAKPYPAEIEPIHDWVVANMVRPVEFVATIEAAYAAGARLFVECGAGGQLADCVGDILGDRPHLALAIDSRQRHGVTQLQSLLGSLLAEGVNLDPAELFRVRGLAADHPAALAASAPADAAARPAVLRFLADSAAAFRQHQALVRETLAAGVALTEQVLATGERVLLAALAPAEQAVAPVTGPFLGTLAVGDGVAEGQPRLEPTLPYLVDHAMGRFAPRAPEALPPLTIVPATVTVEILAETAAGLCPGQPLREVSEFIARRPALGGERLLTRAELRGPGEAKVVLLDPAEPEALPRAEGVYRFGPRPEPPLAGPFALADPAPPIKTAAELYAHRVMFHGPSYQGISHLTEIGADGTRGRLRALPRAALLDLPAEPELLWDPALLDAVGQMFGAWPLQMLEENVVVFPTNIDRLEFFAPPPAPGEEVECRIRLVGQTAKRLVGDIDLVSEGRVIARLSGWRFWRFNWPRSVMEATRYPREWFVTEPLVEAVAAGLASAWLSQRRPLELTAFLEPTFLTAAELAEQQRRPEANRGREHYFLGRLAAKDAVRRWAGEVAVAFNEVEILGDEAGRPIVGGEVVRRLGRTPRVSLAHRAGRVVAVAADGPVGVDVETIEPRDEGFLRLAFTDVERERLASAEDQARGWCAKEAAAKALGLRLADPRQAALDLSNGLATPTVTLAGRTVRVRTTLLDGCAVAVAVAD